MAAAIALRPASAADWPRIHAWLKQPEVQRWWGSLSAAEAAVRMALSAPMGLCSIIEVGGLAVGYAQALEAGQRGNDLPADLTRGAWIVDLFVASAEHRSKGIGQGALRLVTEEVFATTLALALVVVVPIKNEPAVRAYERAGFRWARVIDDALFGPSWLMRLERPRAA